MVDFAVVLVLLAFVLWGFAHGAVFNVLGLVALLVACALSGPLGLPAAKVLLAHTQWTPGVAYLAGRSAAGIIIYLPLTALAAYADRRFRRVRNARLQAVNLGVGAACGLAWGMLVVFFLLCLGDAWVKVMPESGSRLAASMRASWFRGRISGANPADRFLVTDVLRVLRAARRDPEVLGRLRADPYVRRVLSRPDVQGVLDDEGLAQALRANPISAVLRSESMSRLLANKEVRALILSPEMRAALEGAIGEELSAPTEDSPAQGESSSPSTLK